MSDWSLAPAIPLFLVGAVVIGVVGPRLARIADVLADRSGLGSAVAGALFLGASTSLPGIITSVTTAYAGKPSLAVSNAVGGIAAQTVFLAVADFFHRRKNLESAATDPANIFQVSLLIALLGILLFCANAPEFDLWGVHPVSPLLILAYAVGMKITHRTHKEPMWTARRIDSGGAERKEEHEKPYAQARTASLVLRFLLYAAVTGAAGWVIGRAGISIANEAGISETIVGALLTAIATSLPELVTSIASVRAGAIGLAIGNIVGGNAFDTLFAAVADFAYLDGSIYHAVESKTLALLGLTVLLNGVLVMGLIAREREGPAKIGLESTLMLAFYITGMILLAI